MKTYSLYFLLIILFISCSDEDKTLTPSYADINWFELSDSPDEQEVFVMKFTKIPIYPYSIQTR